MIKHQIFVIKYLPVQTQQNKHWQRSFDLFKLINKDNTAMPLTRICSVVVIAFRHDITLQLNVVTVYSTL